tara:strand:+ start:226 stop:453 length:228 start_codon:yes stop_codon:yes gene_type:complete
MPIGLGVSLGVGGGKPATSGGVPIPVASGFNIDVRATKATILARSGDATGVIAYGTDTYDLYVYDGTNWQTYKNS